MSRVWSTLLFKCPLCFLLSLLFWLGCVRTRAKVCCVMDTDPSFLLPPPPLRHVPDMLGCLESTERAGGGERKRDMTINHLSRHLRGRYARQLVDGWTDGEWDTDIDGERVGGLYAHYAQISAVRPDAFSRQEFAWRHQRSKWLFVSNLCI